MLQQEKVKYNEEKEAQERVRKRKQRQEELEKSKKDKGKGKVDEGAPSDGKSLSPPSSSPIDSDACTAKPTTKGGRSTFHTC